ncbi:MAG TPA: hypothetical protein VF761_16765 [Gemmatimonadaceae bacterium]
MNLYAPNGKIINGTLERLEGVAIIDEVVTLGDGPLLPADAIKWEGITEIDWDSQKTATAQESGRIFVDEEGGRWPESAVVRATRERIAGGHQ